MVPVVNERAIVEAVAARNDCGTLMVISTDTLTKTRSKEDCKFDGVDSNRKNPGWIGT